jgi:ABC transporter substrate binding protein
MLLRFLVVLIVFALCVSAEAQEPRKISRVGWLEVCGSYPRPQQLADFALKAHLPTMHAFSFFVDAGGLMSYGATQSEIYTTAAEQVAKILDGARPGELPLRQAMRFELVSTSKQRRHSTSQFRSRCCTGRIR